MRLALVWLTWAMVLAIVLCAVAGLHRWRIGKPALVDWRAGLLAMPRRYLVDVHGVVARRKPAARMHALLAGGLLGSVLLLLLGIVPVVFGAGVYWSAVGLCMLCGLLGTALAAGRRLPSTPPHLSAGRFLVLPLFLACFMGGGLFMALPSRDLSGLPAFAALTVAAIGAGGLVELVRRGPMRHAVAGFVALAAHPRAARFGGGRDVALRPLDLADATLGCAVAADFAWNRLASFDSCVQCGRCEEACPAFAAGQKLNPKHLIRQLAASLPGGPAMAYSGSLPPHASIPDPVQPGPVVGTLISHDTLWACTTCRACVEECPMMIEHVDAVIDLRRYQTLMLGAVPAAAAVSLANLRTAADPEARALERRTDFAAGLKLPVLAEGEETDILLWLGDGAFDLRYGRTLRPLLLLMQRAGLRYACLGEAETSSGDLARRLGDEATFQHCAREVVDTLSRRHFARIVTADPHELNILRHEYPAFGGHWKVLHHTELLDALVTEGLLSLSPRDQGRVVFHDPCYLGRYNGEFAAPRRLLEAACNDRVEMQRHGARAMCCGGGGGNPLSDVDAEIRIPDLRMRQAQESRAAIVAVACPGCTAMLEGVAGARPQVRDIAELVLEALQVA